MPKQYNVTYLLQEGRFFCIDAEILLSGSNNDNITKQKHNPKLSPDGIVMIIHNYTWIDISGTISETVSHTLANGTLMYRAITTHGSVSLW